MRLLRFILPALAVVLCVVAVGSAPVHALGAGCDDPVLAVHPPCSDIKADTCDKSLPASQLPESCKNPLIGPKGTITNATKLVSFLVGVASVVMLVIGGLKYIISSGDSSGVQSAKNTLLYAVIGLAITIVSQAIVIFVLARV